MNTVYLNHMQPNIVNICYRTRHPNSSCLVLKVQSLLVLLGNKLKNIPQKTSPTEYCVILQYPLSTLYNPINCYKVLIEQRYSGMV